jgi:hypothetical protein
MNYGTWKIIRKSFLYKIVLATWWTPMCRKIHTCKIQGKDIRYCIGSFTGAGKYHRKNRQDQVSSDRDQSSFDDYFKEMPWLTIPYDDEEKRVNIFNYYQEFNLKNRDLAIYLIARVHSILYSDSGWVN